MSKKFTKEGKELPDRKRVEIPIGYRTPETMEQKLRRVVAGALSEQAAMSGLETFEESNDFDVGPEDGLAMPDSRHELTPMEEEIAEVERGNRDVQDFANRNPDKIRRRKKEQPAPAAPSTAKESSGSDDTAA